MAKRTHAEFLDIVEEKYKGEYTVLSEYVSKRKKVLVRHNPCGYEFETAAENMVRKGRGKCPDCKTAWNKRTHKEYEVLFNEIAKGEYSLLSEYTTATAKVKMKHHVCDHVWEAAAHHFLEGVGCPVCGHAKAMDKQALDHEEFKKRIDRQYGEEMTLISKYERMSKLVEVKHNPCGHIFKKTAADVLAGCSCPKCKEEQTMTTDKFEQKVKEVTKGECVVLGEYINSKTKVKTKHLICNYVWEAPPAYFLYKHGTCPKCSGDIQLTTQDFIERVNKLTNGEYELLSEYQKSALKVKMKHKACGTIFKITPSRFTHGGRCPKCSRSIGELRIDRFLNDKGIKNKPQFRFKDCRNIKPLPFDFAVFEKDQLICLIEYHGKQHYEPIDFFGGEENFKVRQKLDNIKENYCKRNNIPLIIIPYHEKDIEGMLEEELNTLSALV